MVLVLALLQHSLLQPQIRLAVKKWRHYFLHLMFEYHLYRYKWMKLNYMRHRCSKRLLVFPAAEAYFLDLGFVEFKSSPSSTLTTSARVVPD